MNSWYQSNPKSKLNLDPDAKLEPNLERKSEPDYKSCICNDVRLAKTISCFNCNKKWVTKKPHNERVADCPLHHMNVDVCDGIIPSLCGTCYIKGFRVEPKSTEWFPEWVIVEPNSSKDE